MLFRSDALGRSQAQAVGERLSSFGPLQIVSSPLRRCRETAAPLAALWSAEVAIDARVAEIPSPDGVAMADRVEWLREAMAGSWTALGQRYVDYRDDVVRAIAFLARTDAARGPFNVTAPGVLRQHEFVSAAARAYGMPAWLALPAAPLRLLGGEMSDLFLRGQRVVPERLTALGFRFAFPDIDAVLREFRGGGAR